MQQNLPANTEVLLNSAFEAALGIIQANYEELSNQIDIDDFNSRQNLSAYLADLHGHQMGNDGEFLTADLFSRALGDIFQIQTPPNSPHAEEGFFVDTDGEILDTHTPAVLLGILGVTFGSQLRNK